MLITERPGRLRIVRNGTLLPQAVDGVPAVVHSTQGGLLEVAPHPDFAANRLLYLTYSKDKGDGSGPTTALVRGRFENDRLTNVQPLFQSVSTGRGHFGGKIAFDANGFLFLTLGDRQVPPEGKLEAHPAQDLTNHHGTVVRLHDDGRVPADNPFVNRAGARPEIWSYGHRNVQGIAINAETGDVWIDEHGPQGGDELNRLLPGRNYGWPVIGFGVNYTTGLAIHAGTHREGMEQPVHIWVPSIGISGLLLYTGDRFPQWKGNLFVGRHDRPAPVTPHDAGADGGERGDCLPRGAAASATCVRASTASSTSSPTTATASRRRCCGSSRWTGPPRSSVHARAGPLDTMTAPRSWSALALAAGFVAAAAVATAQTAAVGLDRAGLDAELGRIFQAGLYDPPSFGPARWLPDGSAYSTVEPAPAGGASDIVRYDAATGERRVLVPGTRLLPPGRDTALAISDYAWSADGARLLVFTNTTKVWRQHTRGDYWVLDLSSGRLRQLGAAAPASSLMFAKFSPDATRVAYVRANNLYVERLADGRVTQLTATGSDTVVNGTSDWVYEEELDVRDGFRWSPDGTRLAYWQFDTAGVGLFTLLNNTDSLYPVATRIPYPKPGTPNSAARIGVVSAAGGATTWMQTPGDARDSYLARLEWRDADTLAVQQLNRLQNQQDLLSANATSGRVTRTFRDRSETWLDVVDEVRWVDHGRSFLWISERDGWRHIYRAAADGSATTLVTPFAGDILQLSGTDAAGEWVYFIASPDQPTTRYLYRSRLDGRGAPERLTPASQPGTHSYRLAPGGRLAFHTYSRFDVPPVTDVVELPGHTVLRTLTDTAPLRQALAPVLTRPVEFFTVDIGGGVTLDGWMLKPSHFDPARTYPLLTFVYGEPASVTVTDAWPGRQGLFHRALAEAGYVVVSVDNRGTPAPKGAPWRKAVYGAVGDLSSKDQAAAVRALLARHPFLDATRVGVWGWSGGGSNTLNCLFRFPEVYQVGVAVAPVPDQALYDTIYQERYMGLPTSNAAGYALGSPIHFAAGLQGDLLLIHGSGDDNVHVQGTERLVNRLIELGKPFDVMIYPNRSHAIAEGAGTTVHVYRKIARYFLDHLPAGAR